MEEVFEPAFLMYGVPVGTDAYCSSQLMVIAGRIFSGGQKAAQLLAGEKHALYFCSLSFLSKCFHRGLSVGTMSANVEGKGAST